MTLIPRAMRTLPVVLVLGACAPQDPPATLPALAIDPDRVAVAGLSSGAYMATQAHLAWNERIHGAALIAGGPYQCAQGDLQRALGICMKADTGAPDVQTLAATVRTRAAAGELAPLAALANDRVLILHASDDRVVDPALARSTAALYTALAADTAQPISITVDDDRTFGHALPTLTTGAACGESVSPFLAACGFDAAGAVFEALFGPPVTQTTAVSNGSLQRFDQHAYIVAGTDPLLAADGFVYIPAACAAGAECGLLTVFHGCDQSVEKVGEVFVREAGFNGWADVHQTVVLYPQTRSTYMPLNPKGCWDWWGYTGPGYDTRSGPQQAWLDATMTALGVPSAP